METSSAGKARILALSVFFLILVAAVVPSLASPAFSHGGDDQGKGKDENRQGRGNGDDDDEEQATSISSDAALDIARGFISRNFNVDASRLTLLEFERKSSRFEVELTDGTRTFEVEIDGNGQVTEAEVEGVEVTPREVIIQREEGNVLRIDLQKVADSQRDRVSIRFDTSRVALALEFKRDAASTRSSFDFKAVFGELVEYVDVNGNSQFEGGTDTRVSGFSLPTLAWSTPTVESITVAGKSGNRITISAQLQGATTGGSGQIRLVQTVFGEFAQIGSISLRPTEMKIDIEINNYPFATSPDNTRLALSVTTRMNTDATITVDTSQPQEGVLTAAVNELTGIFSWKTTVMVDGVDRPVVTSIIDSTTSSRSSANRQFLSGTSEKEQTVVFNYPRGSQIVHDPKVGIIITGGLPSGILGPITVVSVAGILTVVMVALISLARIGKLEGGLSVALRSVQMFMVMMVVSVIMTMKLVLGGIATKRR